MTTAERPSEASTLLAVRGLKKCFGPTRALGGADLDVAEREIHGLVGSSGAGKSTLLNIVSGLERVDEGTIVFRNYPISLRSRRDAIRVGIAMVSQEAALMPDLTIYDNIVLPAFGRLSRSEPADLRKRVTALLDAFGPANALPLDAPAYRLSTPQLRLVAIARALVTHAKLYIFDEPFASLSPREIDGLMGVMMRLRMAGCGLIVASGRLEDVLPFADRVTVLAEGTTVMTGNPHREDDLKRLRDAIGAPVAPAVRANPKTAAASGRLVVCRLTSPPEVAEASFAVAGGEILAVHGLRGSGCAALLEAVAGLRARRRGSVDLDGTALAAGRVRAGTRTGLAYASPAQALALPQGSARDNRAFFSGLSTWPVEALWQSLDLPDASLDRPLAQLPAGVRQRIAIAFALRAGPAAVLLADPTRGLAPHERASVHATLGEAAARGAAVVLSCPDRDEALAIADRCLIMREGRSVGDLPTAALDGEALTLLASPEAAIARNTSMLVELTRENGGAAFWALMRDDHLICLNAAVADARADPGFSPTSTARFASTRIATALSRRMPGFVVEPDGGRATVLVPIHTRRGRPMGWIGLTLPADVKPPPAAAVSFRVETLAATL